MTKKHFVAFAREIKELVDSGQNQSALAAFYVIVAVASNDNPRFDQERFRKACGL